MQKRKKFRNLMRPQPEAGFTLIELLIVIFIISIVTSIALLTINHNENRQLASFTNEVAQILSLAEEQAMLQPAVLGVSLDDEALQFTTYQFSVKAKKEVWVPLQDKLLGKHLIPSNIQLSVTMGKIAAGATQEQEKSTVPQIVISTNGDITPFTIYVGKKGQAPRYAILGDIDGTITTQLLS